MKVKNLGENPPEAQGAEAEDPIKTNSSRAGVSCLSQAEREKFQRKAPWAEPV